MGSGKRNRGKSKRQSLRASQRRFIQGPNRSPAPQTAATGTAPAGIPTQGRLGLKYINQRRKRLNSRYVELDMDSNGGAFFSFTPAYQRHLSNMQRTLPASTGILPEHIEAYSGFAVVNDTAVLMRNVNPRAGELLKRPDVIGKPMLMKGKSSNGGKGDSTFDPTTGFIPRDQIFSKISLDNPEKITKFQRKVDSALAEAKASADQLTTKAPDQSPRFWYYIENPGGTYDFVYNYSGKLEDENFFSLNKRRNRNGEPGEVESPYGVSAKKPIPLEVLGDPKTGKLYTADYDPLIYALNVEQQKDLSFDSLANEYYQQINADSKLRIAQETLLNTIIIHPDAPAGALRVRLEAAHRLQKQLNEFDARQENEAATGALGRARKNLVKDLTEALRDVYQEIEASKGNIEGAFKNLLLELQTSIEDTELETPGVLEIRSGITLQEDVMNAYLNKETERATWHASETTNKGAFREELYDDLKTGVAVFLPSGEIRLIRNEDDPAAAEIELVTLMNQLRQQGYAVIPNPRWGWEMDKKGILSIPQDGDRVDFNLLNEEIQKIDNEALQTQLKREYEAVLLMEAYEYRQHPPIRSASKSQGFLKDLGNFLGYYSGISRMLKDYNRKKSLNALTTALYNNHPKIRAAGAQPLGILLRLNEDRHMQILQLLNTDVESVGGLIDLIRLEQNQRADLILKLYQQGQDTAGITALLGANADASTHLNR